VIDLVEIGSGGGSIGWVDNGGALRVGPRSAGADPGPACYARGGMLPTVTDANLILSRISSESFLGGKMKLSMESATNAMECEIASRLGLSLTEAAFGMIEIANSNMIDALRMISVQRGFDPREFVLVAFGGAGPLQANAIAADVGIREVIIPMSPGVSSALGLLLADLKHDFVRTYIRLLNKVDLDFINATFRTFEDRGREALRVERVPDDKQSFLCEMDMRYAGQSFELKVPLLASRVDEQMLQSLEDIFHTLHERAYGHSTPGEPIEVVNLRLTAKGIIPKPKIKRLAYSHDEVARALKGRRDVCFSPIDGYVMTPIYDRYQLLAGSTITGPTVIEEFDSTIVVLANFSASVDEFGSVHIVRAEF
jgi:N-methylhydantoinase A